MYLRMYKDVALDEANRHKCLMKDFARSWAWILSVCAYVVEMFILLAIAGDLAEIIHSPEAAVCVVMPLFIIIMSFSMVAWGNDDWEDIWRDFLGICLLLGACCLAMGAAIGVYHYVLIRVPLKVDLALGVIAILGITGYTSAKRCGYFSGK